MPKWRGRNLLSGGGRRRGRVGGGSRVERGGGDKESWAEWRVGAVDRVFVGRRGRSVRGCCVVAGRVSFICSACCVVTCAAMKEARIAIKEAHAAISHAGIAET